ncbi:hypothetical protein [Streptomyces sp. NPDC047123]|uniref:hypothetical protein n=1 Tax=Streptomyces sp. NPDC047123 TaxID=3155622 RepID=UPI0033FF3109
MYRSTTTAALLVSMAVSAAVSGCVSVERPTGSGPAAATASPPAPRADGRSRPRVVQAPAREALERMGPPPRPAARRSAAAAPSPAPPAPPARPAPPPSRHTPEAAARRPGAGADRPATPPRTPTVPSGADVCTLGEAYGNWNPDSPQAVICRDVYGR